jgi:hypothetical protein
MKNKNIKKHPNHHPTVHIRIERFFRHRSMLTLILSFMAIGVVKYQTHMLGVIQEMYYGQGFGMLSSYTHHDEVTRMPVSYGSSVRTSPISGE